MQYARMVFILLCEEFNPLFLALISITYLGFLSLTAHLILWKVFQQSLYQVCFFLTLNQKLFVLSYRILPIENLQCDSIIIKCSLPYSEEEAIIIPISQNN